MWLGWASTQGHEQASPIKSASSRLSTREANSHPLLFRLCRAVLSFADMLVANRWHTMQTAVSGATLPDSQAWLAICACQAVAVCGTLGTRLSLDRNQTAQLCRTAPLVLGPACHELRKLAARPAAAARAAALANIQLSAVSLCVLICGVQHMHVLCRLLQCFQQ